MRSLRDLRVAPHHQGGGAGRTLIDAVHAAAEAPGRGTVYRLTEAGNVVVRSLPDLTCVATPIIKYRRRSA